MMDAYQDHKRREAEALQRIARVLTAVEHERARAFVRFARASGAARRTREP